MHHMDLIMGKHDIEDIRKRRNQTRPQGVGKLRDLGGYPIDGEVGRGPGRRPPAFIEDGGQGQADLARALGGGRQRRRARRRHGFLPSSLLRRSHDDGKGGGEFEIGLKTEAGGRAQEEQRALERQKGERLCTTTSPPSMAQNKGGMGEQCRPRPINRHVVPKTAGC